MWGFAVSLIVCTITLTLMMFMLPTGIMDGIFAGSALTLILMQYLGIRKYQGRSTTRIRRLIASFKHLSKPLTVGHRGHSMDYRVLMIDDDETIAASTAEYFNIFDIKTAYVTSYKSAVEFLRENTVSLLLLDINLGDKSGFELCKKIRSEYDMPIFFISARNSDDDVLMALNIGGDDYIKKPYTVSILLAKVRAALNRYGQQPKKGSGKTAPPHCITITDDMYLDTRSHCVYKQGKNISLKAMEFNMLKYMLDNRNKVISKDEFLKNVWEDEYVGEGTLSVHIRHLREKIEDDPNVPLIIKTVWGTGYIMEE